VSQKVADKVKTVLWLAQKIVVSAKKSHLCSIPFSSATPSLHIGEVNKNARAETIDKQISSK
jgi:hypothetical protein